MAVDRVAVMEAVASLARSATEDVPVATTLKRLCDTTADVLGLSLVGVVRVEPGRHRSVVTSGPPVQHPEVLQELLRDGPCADAARSGTIVHVAGPELDPRWGELGRAGATADVRRVVALPMTSRGECWGVLHLCDHRAGPWPVETLAAARCLADTATASVVLASDREAARLAQAQLVHQSTHDAVTGLANRVGLLDRLDEMLSTASSRSCVGVVLADLNALDDVVGSLGYSHGDELLSEAGQDIAATAEPDDLVARLSADRFVVVRGDVAGPVHHARLRVQQLCSGLVAALSRDLELAAGQVVVSPTVGGVVVDGRRSARDVIDEAVVALRGSDPGRPNVVHAPSSGPRAQSLAADRPTDALGRGELVVYYQPVVQADAPHRIDAVEALLRWVDRDGAVIAAHSFIDLALSRGLMPQIGTFVIQQACAQMRDWLDRFGRTAPQVVYVNLSSREMAGPSLSRVLATSLERHDLQPGNVGLEVVEHEMADQGLVDRVIELRRQGHPISLDDFGTGYSSLSRLFDTRIDRVKLDRAFVQGLPHDERKVAFVDAFMSIASALSLPVVAEGVETPGQHEFLADAGCEYLQGFWFARPSPARDVTEMIARRPTQVSLTHELTRRRATTDVLDVARVLREWWDDPTQDISDAIADIAGALGDGGRRRDLENYLGIDVERG